MEQQYLYRKTSIEMVDGDYEQDVEYDGYIVSSEPSLESDNKPERKFLKHWTDSDGVARINQYKNLGTISTEEIETLKKFKIIL